MIVFEVKLNGKVVCTAGVGEFGFLFTEVMWEKRNPVFQPKAWPHDQLILHTTGLQVVDESIHEHLRWENKSLSIGDKIVIRVLDRTECDPPVRRERSVRPQAKRNGATSKRNTRRPVRKKRVRMKSAAPRGTKA